MGLRDDEWTPTTATSVCIINGTLIIASLHINKAVYWRRDGVFCACFVMIAIRDWYGWAFHSGGARNEVDIFTLGLNKHVSCSAVSVSVCLCLSLSISLSVSPHPSPPPIRLSHFFSDPSSVLPHLCTTMQKQTIVISKLNIMNGDCMRS